MLNQDNEIDKLIYLISKLPGLGIRSARRIVLHLIEDKDMRLGNLIYALEKLKLNINRCNLCGNLDSENVCKICVSSKRDKDVIAVVETVTELWAIERVGIFKGLYHVLGKKVDKIRWQDRISQELSKLLNRCQLNSTKEIIIATNATLEGQTIAYYITEYFKDHEIIISRLASGIPIGGEIDYLDDGTLSTAITLRRIFS